MADSKKGIWGNTECVQCGACCYAFYLRYGRLCEHQEFRIEGDVKKSYCKNHEHKAPICRNFFCDDIQKIVKDGLRKYAKILGTVPNENKNDAINKVLYRFLSYFNRFSCQNCH